ncbi:polysaccharide biosynthesis/export family protein [Bythopirellula goksoeyrii]|uniref:SLBB domain protein n=1 Tax=Bythopirellula goksoeyrii TaxID=1400387 RepID=A0A5B9QR98_9BACT|nr:SLBB domain-containing protein [Bythopirellula goksoeyrii]QEG36651.1 SLBB domain protein [Bythopirellula goksoeyrii]
MLLAELPPKGPLLTVEKSALHITWSVFLLLIGSYLAGCQSAQYRAASLPNQFRAKPSPGDVSVNMARLTGAGYDNSLIGPDDMLEITVMSGRNEEKPVPLVARVSKDGAVDVSPIGPVAVKNLDPAVASERIAKAAVERGIFIQPNITVEIKKKAVNHITVLGAVEKPGLHEVSRNSSDVVSALALAGGLTDEAGTEVEIIRQHVAKRNTYTRFADYSVEQPPTNSEEEGSVQQTAYNDLFPEGPPAAQAKALTEPADEQVARRIDLASLPNHYSRDEFHLEDRDVVMVKARKKRSIHVGGLVEKPGQFELPATEDLRMLDAIALAGGSSSLMADKVYVIRQVAGEPKPVVILASMQKAKQDGAENLLMAEGDMISIEQTPITAVYDALGKFMHLTVGVSGNSFF